MIKKILSWFAWERSHISGCNTYYENSVTGERMVVSGQGGYSPIEQNWIDRNANSIHIPPIGGSGIVLNHIK